MGPVFEARKTRPQTSRFRAIVVHDSTHLLPTQLFQSFHTLTFSLRHDPALPCLGGSFLLGCGRSLP